jgi:deferrochelatase/peroxidase EfeB
MNLDSSHVGSGVSFQKNESILSCIQPLIGRGYKRCSRHCYFFSIDDSIHDPLSALLNEGRIKSGAHLLDSLFKLSIENKNHPNLSIKAGFDIGFTFRGLQKLKIEPKLLDVFRKKSPAFSDNAFLRASRHLGDTGESAPEHWQRNFQSLDQQSGFDAVCMIHIPISQIDGRLTENVDCLQVLETHLFELLLNRQFNLQQEGIQWPIQSGWIERAMPLDDLGTEHFGYRDGITAPVYSADAPEKDTQGYRDIHALGELLLGHPRNDGDNLYADLNFTKQANTHLDPQVIPREEAYKSFFNNSSFAVIRKMEQRVDRFNAWVDSAAKSLLTQDVANGVSNHPSDSYALAKRWVKSKVMGRSPDGVLLEPHMRYQDLLESPKASKTDPNDFHFHHRDSDGRPTAADDSQGLGCPFSSHIRRMNPRDDPVTPFIHRPVLRRGMPYTDAKSKGMLGLFFCADIVEQFEHLVGAWGQHRVMGIPDRSRTRDPIIGQHEPETNKMYLDIPGQQSTDKVAQFTEPFVVTRGCAYVWFPSVDTLNNLQKFQA